MAAGHTAGTALARAPKAKERTVCPMRARRPTSSLSSSVAAGALTLRDLCQAPCGSPCEGRAGFLPRSQLMSFFSVVSLVLSCGFPRFCCKLSLLANLLSPKMMQRSFALTNCCVLEPEAFIRPCAGFGLCAHALVDTLGRGGGGLPWFACKLLLLVRALTGLLRRPGLSC